MLRLVSSYNSQRLCRPTYPGYMYKRIGSPCELGSLLTDKSMGSNRPRPRPRRPRDAPVATKQPTIASRNNEEEPTVGVPTASTTVHDFPDDVLELVLLRLPRPRSVGMQAVAPRRGRRRIPSPLPPPARTLGPLPQLRQPSGLLAVANAGHPRQPAVVLLPRLPAGSRWHLGDRRQP